MCSSENELIHDVRQVHLEELIMKNEEQFVMVRLPLSDRQVSEFNKAENGEHTRTSFIRSVGTPIPPCADVETVGWGRETSFVDIKAPGCHAVSIHKEWEGGIPLVRRTDMEAQAAKVAAEKDAEIGRLKEILSLFAQYENLMDAGADIPAMAAYAIFSQTVAKTLNEGSAA